MKRKGVLEAIAVAVAAAEAVTATHSTRDLSERQLCNR